jgi:hypothetical protein
LLGASLALLAQACGAEDTKKKDPRKTFDGEGGEAGEGSGGSTNTAANGGSGGGSGGSAGTGATSGSGTGGTPSDGGVPGSSEAGMGNTSEGGAGTSGTAGASDGGTGTAGAPGDGCPEGMAECDGNPDTVCERNINLPTSCGDCTTVCSGNNAFPVCEDQICKIESCLGTYANCDGEVEDGCETNLNDNDVHCGECGRNCAAHGATCETDRCSTIPLQTGVGFNVAGGNSFAGSYAFTSQGLLHAGSYDYSVRRFPLNGAPAVSIWVADNVYAGHFTLLPQGDDVLWAQRGTPSAVLKKAISAAVDVLPTPLFYPEYQPMFLREQAGAYYWITGEVQGEPGYVYTRSVAAGSGDAGARIVNVDQGRNSMGFVVTSDAIYWVPENDGNAGTVDGDLRYTPLAGGTPTSVPAVSAGDASVAICTPGSNQLEPSLQVAGDTVYFTHTVATSPINGIWRFKMGDTIPTQVVSAESITSMVIDATDVYFSRQNVGGVWRAPLSGGAAVTISSGNIEMVLGVDDTYVYAMTSQYNLYKVIK